MDNDLHLLCMIGHKERIQELLTQNDQNNSDSGSDGLSLLRRLNRVRFILFPT
jgi:hypothetical protein